MEPRKNKDLADLVIGFEDSQSSTEDVPLEDALDDLNIDDEKKNDGDAQKPVNIAEVVNDVDGSINLDALLSILQSGQISPEITRLLRMLGMKTNVSEKPELDEKSREAVLGGKPSLEAIGANMKAGKYKNVIIMSGAGLSTAAGIPDFRSPEKGLYATIATKYKSLTRPEDVFTLSFFERNPQPFWRLCRELDLFGNNSTYKPTKAHYLSKLLENKGLLLRTFTQNIDALDRRTGLSEEKLMEAHGSAHGAYCIKCGIDQELERVQIEVDKEEVPRCSKKSCEGLVKPKITFFGEALPSRFHKLVREDFPKCDLLIVMGTSLAVAPFCHLVSDVTASTPRLLINLGDVDCYEFRFNQPGNYRDVFEKTTCDKGVERLVELCGWKEDFDKLLESVTVKPAESAVDDFKEEVKLDTDWK